jgi:hypothetical protein
MLVILTKYSNFLYQFVYMMISMCAKWFNQWVMAWIEYRSMIEPLNVKLARDAHDLLLLETLLRHVKQFKSYACKLTTMIRIVTWCS